jgi:hypothetical protein
MNRTVSRWYPVLIMRDALGRFAKLRIAVKPKPPAKRRRPRWRIDFTAVQLTLF